MLTETERQRIVEEEVLRMQIHDQVALRAGARIFKIGLAIMATAGLGLFLLSDFFLEGLTFRLELLRGWLAG